MVRVAIVEDEAPYAALLQKLLARYQQEHQVEFRVTLFSDGTEIATRYRGEFDLILLDIQMRSMDGLTAAEQIRKADEAVPIIFVTQMAQYAIRGYAVGALDFMLKPVSYIEFSKKLKRGLDAIRRHEKKYVTLPIDGGVIRFELGQIYYIESRGHHIILHSKTDSHTHVGTMKEMERRLQPDGFFRCNNCYLVHLAHVESVHGYTLRVGRYDLQISRPRKKEFMQALTDYMGETML